MGLFDRFKQKVTSIVEQSGLNKLTEGLKKLEMPLLID